jgi:hypothetical protein
MKFNKFKRKSIIISIILIISGTLISIAGFGLVGFKLDVLKENGMEDAWYQTIHINNDNLWYGVALGDNIYIINIGNAE